MRKLLFQAILIALFLPYFLFGEVKICLTMVVKNEEEVIERCLNSVAGIIDCLSICDVGSTDRTIPMIQEFLQKTGKPGKITSIKFENNRTIVAKTAQKDLKEWGFPLSKTYLLVLDADMTVEALSAFKKRELEADYYYLPEESVPLSCYHYNARLLRASKPWENQGWECGAWVYEGPQQGAKLMTLTVQDRGDGNLTADLRNLEKLEKKLKADPENQCLTMRLAHLHRHYKSYGPALHWYKTRIEQGGDPEEVWFARYWVGKCLAAMGDWTQAYQSYLETFEFNPTRSEPLLEVATHYRQKGQNQIAYLFAKHGSLMERAMDQTLFDSSPLHNFKFDEELAISAFYTPFKKEGYEHSSRLIVKKNVPWHIKDQILKNLSFYAPCLKYKRYFPIAIELPLIRSGHPECYRPMNSSIVKTEEGYSVICRTVNYTQKGAIPSNFKTLDPKGIFRTKNYLLRYDHAFHLISQQEIVENLPREQFATIVDGLEDCRLFEWNQRLWFTCTTRDMVPSTTPQIALCQLEENKGASTIAVERLIHLKGPDPNRCEKNWLPFIKEDQLHLIYSYDPLIVYHFNQDRCDMVLSQEQTHNDFTHFRGSAAPVVFDDGYLMLIHETAQFPDWSRYYFHRFVYMDNNFNIRRISKPFNFFHIGIEFCCSMTINHEETELILGVGVEDTQAFLCFVGLDTIRSMLTDLSTE